MNKETLINNFSRNAYDYDKYAQVQHKAAFELLSRIKDDSFKRILEVGCGTGNYTSLLREKFKQARIKAIDISEKMIEVASAKLKDNNIELMVQDAENLGLDEGFDLVTSNACFQWFEDLEKALIRYKGMLKKEGVIAFSIFGPRTFWELNYALKRVLTHGDIAAVKFIPQDKIKTIFNNHFKEARIEERRYEEYSSSLIGLLNKIKHTGARGEVKEKFSFDRRILKEIEDNYLNKFKGIRATYQILFCRGVKG